jgi:hypothetical protein
MGWREAAMFALVMLAITMACIGVWLFTHFYPL